MELKCGKVVDLGHPSSWYEKKRHKLIKQSGGVVCLPCVAAVNPASVTAALGAIGLTAVKVAKSNKKTKQEIQKKDKNNLTKVIWRKTRMKTIYGVKETREVYQT